jgi:transcriptional regulator with XRE-family HTH domain
MSVFAKRLKEARTEAGLSQERLGVLAGIEEMSASARMNQYERGKHEPDFSMVERIAGVLHIPTAYFYAVEDETARLILAFGRLSKRDRSKAIDLVEQLKP